jgi:hypothetical protein
MSRFVKFKFLCAALMFALAAHAPSALACAVCFGQSDSPIAQAAKWGVFALLAVVVCVLGAIASFFIFLAKKAAAVAAATPSDLTASTSKA